MGEKMGRLAITQFLFLVGFCGVVGVGTGWLAGNHALRTTKAEYFEAREFRLLDSKGTQVALMKSRPEGGGELLLSYDSDKPAIRIFNEGKGVVFQMNFPSGKQAVALSADQIGVAYHFWSPDGKGGGSLFVVNDKTVLKVPGDSKEKNSSKIFFVQNKSGEILLASPLGVNQPGSTIPKQ